MARKNYSIITIKNLANRETMSVDDNKHMIEIEREGKRERWVL